jgi:uncharacterized Fe-S cluster protein YjdI/CDGSH-type Zn-finger protein
MRRSYRGTGIEVTFDLARCIHVAECLRGLPEVFDVEERPWIEPDAADPDRVAEVVARCPSGALQYRRLDGGPQEFHPATRITPTRNGPLLVEGEIRVVLENGAEEVLPRATLCRCGASARKPFCDNSHLGIGFVAAGEPLRVHISAIRPNLMEPVRTVDDPRREDADDAADADGVPPGPPPGR